MARDFLRPGNWKLTYSGSGIRKILIDDEEFTIPPGSPTAQTIEFACSKHASFNGTDIEVYRNPVQAVVNVNAVGQTGNFEGIKTKAVSKIRKALPR